MKRLFLFTLLFVCSLTTFLNGNMAFAVDYIEEIALASSYSESDAKQTLRDNGYQILDRDLNENTGSSYIYLGYKTTNHYRDAITNLIITIGESSKGDRIWDEYHYSDVTLLTDFTGDLNYQAGGYCLFLKYTKDGKDKNTPALTGLNVRDNRAVWDIFHSYSNYVFGLHNNNTTTTFPVNLNEEAGGSNLYLEMTKQSYSGEDIFEGDFKVEYLGNRFFKFEIPVIRKDDKEQCNSIFGYVYVNQLNGNADNTLFYLANHDQYYDERYMSRDDEKIDITMVLGKVYDYRTFEDMGRNPYCIIEGGNHKTNRFATILWQAPSESEKFDINNINFELSGKIAKNNNASDRKNFKITVSATIPQESDGMNAPIVIEPFINTDSDQPGWAKMMVTSSNKMQSFACIDEEAGTALSYPIDQDATSMEIDLRPREEEHHLTVLALINKMEILKDGTQDYGYSLATVPVTQKAFHSIVKDGTQYTSSATPDTDQTGKIGNYSWIRLWEGGQKWWTSNSYNGGDFREGDPAKIVFGKNWRSPSRKELVELFEKSKIEPGNNGYSYLIGPNGRKMLHPYKKGQIYNVVATCEYADPDYKTYYAMAMTSVSDYKFVKRDVDQKSIMMPVLDEGLNTMLTPTLNWKIANADDKDLIEEDAFIVERAFESDMSDAQVIGSVMFSDSTRNGNDTYAYYTFTDDDEANRYNTKAESTYRSMFNNWENIRVQALTALSQYFYPAYYTYYKVGRTVVKSLWPNNHDYEARWRVVNANILPTVTGIELTKNASWDDDRSVNLKVTLANPYPWELVNPVDSADVHAEAKRQGFDRRLYQWSSDSKIKVERYSASEDHYNGVDEVATTYYINAADIKVDAETGAYYAILEDKLGAPSTHYYYKAMVDTVDNKYPIDNDANTYLSTSANDWTSYSDLLPVNSLTATRGTLQGQVSLQWDPSDGINREYAISYREYGKDDKWTPLDTITESYYNEKLKCEPGKVYEYSVTVLARFRGKIYEAAPSYAIGYNPYYGTISGKILLGNGAAMPGKDLSITIKRVTPEAIKIDEVRHLTTGELIMEGLDQSSFTKVIKVEDDGTYICDSIPYSGSQAKYEVSISGLNGVIFTNSSGVNGPMQVDMSRENFAVEQINFVCNDLLAFSGNILYDGSTVPVRGVRFSVNGTNILDANGKEIVTDSEGRFTFSLPKGMPIALKAVKEGHRFKDDGYIVGSDGKESTPTEGISSKVLYDLTTVRLVGRIIGGDLQAQAPLGMGISKNNLGSDMRMELQLEGDNTANIVYDILHPELSTRNEKFVQKIKANGEDTEVMPTEVEFQRKRIIIHPDNETGEFCVDLFPTKYKITSMSAKGYSTLTADGEGFEVLDLSNCTDTIKVDNVDYLAYLALHNVKQDKQVHKSAEYQATYQRVYHVPATVSMEQYNLAGQLKPYCGESSFNSKNHLGTQVNTALAWEKDGKAYYAFDYPVFRSSYKYRFRVSAHEDYYFNNDKSRQPEVVYLEGGKVNVYNGLESAKSKVEAELDVNGKADVVLNVDNTCFNLTDTAALRNVTAEVEVNGYYYKSDAIRGFILGDQDAGTEIMPLDNNIEIVDVIRDPYGTNSYAWRDKGTEYHWDRSNRTTETFSFLISGSLGGGRTWYIGMGLAEKANFSITAGFNINIPMRKNITGDCGEYTMTLNERIQTSDDPTMVGAMADVYIGRVDVSHLRETTAFSIIDGDSYKYLKDAIATGAVKVVKQGLDSCNAPYYLVVGKRLIVATDSVASTFAYSQKHILGTVIPQLEKRYSELVLNCTKNEADSLAEIAGKPLYYLDNEGNPMMSIPNPNYIGINEALKIKNTIAQWKSHIESNEKLKYNYAFGSNTPIKRYSVSEQPIEYNEEASGYRNHYEYYTHGGQVTGGFNIGGGGKDNNKTQTSNKSNVKAEDKKNTTEFCIAGLIWSFNVNPLSSSYSANPSQTAYIKKLVGTGFKLDMRNNGYMDVDVYKEPGEFILTNGEWGWVTAQMDESDQMKDVSKSDVTTGEYIFVLRGGGMRAPWYDADSTKFYTIGGRNLPLGDRCKKIDNPKIYIANPVASNIKRDDKAIYSIRLTNETEYNGDASLLTPIPLILRLADKTNPNGAKVTMDGAPITDGRKFDLAPGQSITKTIEVARGNGYDFEDIGLVFRDESYTLIDTAKFSVHFTPESTPVSLVQPKNQWVMNTLSDRDKETGQYFLPVEISGFDINYDGFDHIELQYKKQTEGESQWVNLCSFYANEELYNKASGVKQLINGNTISNVPFYGEKDIIEMKYDIRAVSFCRLGTGFITRSSEISSGIKDTRTPEVFGKPTPVNGILGYEDVISVPFNEPIAYNYLDRVANFSVRGFTNNSDANHSARLYFDGGENTYAETKVERSLKETDFTIEMNAQLTKQTGLLFSMDAEDEESSLDVLAFGYNGEKDVLIIVSDGTIYQSPKLTDEGININEVMTHIGMIYKAETKNVKFIVGNKIVDAAKSSSLSDLGLTPSQKITSKITFGYMTGYLSDVRIWHRALNSYEVANKYQKKLSSSEKDLLAWWPMDEAYGNIVADKANGADLELFGVTWETPKGYSAKLDGKPLVIDEGVKLFQTAERQDFSLGFWFKVDNLDGDEKTEEGSELVNIFAAGSETLNDKGEGKMRIGFDNKKLVLRTEGNTIDFGIDNDYVTNGQWHYLTMVTNHSENLASFYIDGSMVTETDADQIGYITGTPVSFGGNGFHGYIDEISMWHIALPQSYISDMKTTALTGTEKELVVYMSFESDELQDDNQMKTVFSNHNQKVSETTGKTVDDWMFDPSTVGQEEDIHAPMKKEVGISNIDFSWTCTDNDLQINLLTKDANINNQRIDLVLRGVEDLQGNPMSNPLMWSIYVNKNILTWDDKTIKVNIPYGEGKDIVATWANKSGRSVYYTIDTNSRWLTIDNTMGMASPLEESEVNIKISDGLAPGEYSAIVNLTDKDGLTSKLYVVANIVATDPDWNVTTNLDYDQTMSITAQVNINKDQISVIDTNPHDIVAAFFDGVCLGKANITVKDANSAYVYLNIRGNATLKDKTLQFYLWNKSHGEITRLKVYNGSPITFSADATIGTHSAPVVFTPDNMGIQTIELKQGWNWVSFNLKSAQQYGVKKLFMDNSVFSDGDQIKGSLNNTMFAEYSEDDGTWTNGADEMAINVSNVYQIYVNKPITVNFEGYDLSTKERMVHFEKGTWSQLPYLLKVPQTITNALSDYTINQKAMPGTIIKSHDAFAIADKSGIWYGSLEYLRPGQGYFVNNVGEGCDVTFNNQTVLEQQSTTRAAAKAKAPESIANEYADAMPVIAMFADDDIQEGDVLVAYSNGMEVGRATASELPTGESDQKQRVYFLMVNASQGSAIHFAKERDGETIDITQRGIDFMPTGIVGTLDRPYTIDFTKTSVESIYDVNGRKYENVSRTSPQDVYIINGKKQTLSK